MGKRKMVFDLIHKYVEISPDVERIIDLESFQRLKYIRQMTALHLYPTANHTRFEHSLGVMKLADDFFERLKPQFETIFNCKKERIDFLYKHLIFSALLHDVGHAPLSHLGESLFDTNEIKECIRKSILNLGIEITLDSTCNGSPHELMSCYVILEKFYSRLVEIYQKFDFDFIFRIVTGTQYKEDKMLDRNIIISIVNSDTIDVDKLDYLMRDNLMTGSMGPQIDVDRIKEALIIVQNKGKLSFLPIGLSAIQKLIDCRDSIYMWVCNHHKVVYTDYLYKECLIHISNLKERGKTNYQEYLDKNDLFSCDAIANK